MPPKPTVEVRKANLAKANLAKADLAKARESPDTDLANALALSWEDLACAKLQVTSLELVVENLEAIGAQLLRDLDAANSKIDDLNLALQAEHERSESWYKSLRAERRARQRGDKQKQALSGTEKNHRDSAAETQRACKNCCRN